uniref:zinc finger and SCAN domain-containing protein 20-like n=1 Tax=Myxine glutinosa TaxID=7769 RepID=UPI0035901392
MSWRHKQEFTRHTTMGEIEDFPAWLQSQGLTMETAQAVVTELGMKSQGALAACTESLIMKAELLSMAKRKLPFSMYAELRRLIDSSWDPQDDRSRHAMLTAVLHSTLSALSRELANCAQKLISMDSVPASEDCCTIGQVDPAVKIVNVCSLDRQQPCVHTIPETRDFYAGETDTGTEQPLDIADPMESVVDEQTQMNNLVKHFDTDQQVHGLNPHVDGENSTAPELDCLSYSTAYCEVPLGNINVKQESYTADNELEVSVHPPAEYAKLLSCSKCSQIFLTENALQLHMEGRHNGRRSHHYSIRAQSHLGSRLRNHTMKKSHKCPVCGKCFTEKSRVRLHMKSHMEKRPHECSVCGKTFIQSSHVKSHMRMHTGERPYKCTICGKAFAEKYALKIHMRVHTGERPYQCSVCGKGFTQASSVKSHMRVHTT